MVNLPGGICSRMSGFVLSLASRRFTSLGVVVGCSPVEGFWRKKILGGGFKYFLFSPLPGEMIQFD